MQYPPWILKNFSEIESSLQENSKDNQFLIKTAFENSISQLKNFTIIYTDASKSGEGSGCAVITSPINIKKRLPSEFSVFSAEVYAIKEALKYIEVLGTLKSVIVTDSKSAINAIKNTDNNHPIIQEIVETYNKVCKIPEAEIFLLWCPSHSGIPGNEEADEIAKNDIKLNQEDGVNIVHSEFLKKATKKFKQQDNENWKANAFKRILNIHENLYDQNLALLFNRNDQVVLSRIAIGHTNLTHIHLITKKERNKCTFCECEIKVEHLLECVHLTNQRQKNYIPADLKRAMQNFEMCKNLIQYLKDINIYNQI